VFRATTRVSPLEPHEGPDAFTPTSAVYALDCELKSWKAPIPPGLWHWLHVGWRMVTYISVNVAGAAAASPTLPVSVPWAELEPPLQASEQSA
jgi:hypothetical protein